MFVKGIKICLTTNLLKLEEAGKLGYLVGSSHAVLGVSVTCHIWSVLWEPRVQMHGKYSYSDSASSHHIEFLERGDNLFDPILIFTNLHQSAIHWKFDKLNFLMSILNINSLMNIPISWTISILYIYEIKDTSIQLLKSPVWS